MKFYPSAGNGHGHFSAEIGDLTPRERPADLTDELWRLIADCAAQWPDFDATEVEEALTEANVQVSLPMVLYVLANR